MPDITHKQLGPLEYELKVVLSRNEVEAETNRYCQEIQKHVVVDGFRKGKTPLEVIRQKFGEQVKMEVSSRLINAQTEPAIVKADLKITGNPTLLEQYRSQRQRKWLGDFKLDGGFVYAVSFEVKPEVKFTGYTGLAVQVDLPNAEEWIAARTSELQNQFADRMQVIRPIQNGDEVAVDFVSLLDGEVLPDGSESWRTICVGQGVILPAFDEQLIGHVPDEELTFSLDFPADYVAKEVAGRKVDFQVKIHTVTEVKLHPLNDELAQKALYENLAHMQSELAEKAQTDFERPRKARILEAVIKEIQKNHTFDIPHCWVENETKVVAYRFGLKQLPTDENELNSLRELAMQSAKHNFILDCIYSQEPSIHLTADEITALLEAEGKRLGKTGAELLGLLKTNGTYEGFISFAEQQKAVDFLINSTTVQQKE